MFGIAFQSFDIFEYFVTQRVIEFVHVFIYTVYKKCYYKLETKQPQKFDYTKQI